MEFADADTTVMRTPVVNDHLATLLLGLHRRFARTTTPMTVFVRTSMRGCWACRRSGCTPGVTVEGGGDTMQIGLSRCSRVKGLATIVPAIRSSWCRLCLTARC